MNSDHAEAIVVRARDACRQLNKIADVYRNYPDLPSAKRRVRFCGDTISTILNDIMMPVLAEHPQLDDKLFEGRFDASNFFKFG